jgi:hypothetical protein
MIQRRVSPVAVAIVAVLGSVVASGPGRAAPANDSFADAREIVSTPFTDSLSTVGATLEPGEPDGVSVCASAGATVWYRYTPPVDGRLVAVTLRSSFNAYVGVFSGTSLETLSLLACDNETFAPLSAGVTYYLQVGSVSVGYDESFYEESGDLVLEVDLATPCAGCPTFENYAVPRDRFRFSAGETSIGVNPKTNATFFMMGTHTLKVTWDDGTQPASATWKDVTDISQVTTLDPILWTDRSTGRTYAVQLLGAGSIIAYTDDDGASWTRTVASVAPSFDHESLGGGPYPPALRGLNPVYPNAVYYCAQVAIAQCARSDDGGLTWGAPLLMNALSGCSGLHGHVVVGADGAVFVPHKACGPSALGQGVAVSFDAGTTWTLRRVPGTYSAGSDPALAFDAGGRLYFAATSRGRPVVATSDDNGVGWTTPIDVGTKYGIRNAEFPMAVAGDAGRAAVAFYGTTTTGYDQSDEFDGLWHIYVSTTYDGGKTWTTVDATPDDPVQRGKICLAGIGCSSGRNLLDFQGMTMDAQGRVLVGYADGCVTWGPECLNPQGRPERSSAGVIARQSSGRGLIAAFDP